MRFTVILAFLLILGLAPRAWAWGPLAHAFLGRQGASDASLPVRDALAVSSGAFLADLDHTLKRPGVVGDSVAFARALLAVPGRSAISDRWAKGWLAHALAQDPGQGEISSKNLKLYADLILDRTDGFQIAGAVFDPERIRKAAIALGTEPPSAGEIRKGVEQFVLLGVVEQALLDFVPLDLDSREQTFGDRLKERLPDFDFIPARLRQAGKGLPSARSLMPKELAHYERRLSESLLATRTALTSAEAGGAGNSSEAPAYRAHPMGHVTLPPPHLMGIVIQTRPARDGMTRTTVSISSALLFEPAALAMLERLGKDLFPSVVLRWDATSRLRSRTSALRQYLRDEGNRWRKEFP